MGICDHSLVSNPPRLHFEPAPDPWYGMGFFRIPDLRSRISDPKVFESLKKYYNSLKIGPNFSLYQFKNKIIYNFVLFVATKKGRTTNFFPPSLLLLLFCDPRWPKLRIRYKYSRSTSQPPGHIRSVGSSTLFYHYLISGRVKRRE